MTYKDILNDTRLHEAGEQNQIPVEEDFGDVSAFPMPKPTSLLVEQLKQIVQELTDGELIFSSVKPNEDSEEGIVVKFESSSNSEDYIVFILGGETNENNEYPNIAQIWELSDRDLLDEIEMHGSIFGRPTIYSLRNKKHLQQLGVVLRKFLHKTHTIYEQVEPTLGDVRKGLVQVDDGSTSIPPPPQEPVSDDLDSVNAFVAPGEWTPEEQSVIDKYFQYYPQMGGAEAIAQVSRELSFPYAAAFKIITAYENKFNEAVEHDVGEVSDFEEPGKRCFRCNKASDNLGVYSPKREGWPAVGPLCQNCCLDIQREERDSPEYFYKFYY